MSEQRLDLLVRKLKALDVQTQRQTVAALVAAGEAAIGPVCAFLTRETRDLKPMAAEVLSKIAVKSSAPALRSALPLLRSELRKASIVLFFMRSSRSEDDLDRIEQVVRTYRTAIARIETATREARALPVPAQPSETSADELPIPSSASDAATRKSGSG